MIQPSHINALSTLAIKYPIHHQIYYIYNRLAMITKYSCRMTSLSSFLAALHSLPAAVTFCSRNLGLLQLGYVIRRQTNI